MARWRAGRTCRPVSTPTSSWRSSRSDGAGIGWTARLVGERRDDRIRIHTRAHILLGRQQAVHRRGVLGPALSAAAGAADRAAGVAQVVIVGAGHRTPEDFGIRGIDVDIVIERLSTEGQ